MSPTRRRFLSLLGLFGLDRFTISEPTPVEAGIMVNAPPALSRPTLIDPVVIHLGTGSDSPQLDNFRDYVLVMPPSVKMGNTTIRGGGNVIIAGGYTSIGAGLDQACFSVKNGRAGRIVHFEGLQIDGRQGGMSDGWQLGCTTTTVQIQRCRIDGLNGALALRHADVIQPSGGMGALHMEGVTGRSHYNNNYFRRENDPLGPVMGPITMSRCNFGGYQANRLGWPQQTLRAISLGTQPIPPSDASSPVNAELSGPVWLYEMYGNAGEAGHPLGQFVWPHDGAKMTSTCRAQVAADGRSVDWPAWRVNEPGAPGVYGVVQLGPPANGDFCKATTVGLNYAQRLAG